MIFNNNKRRKRLNSCIILMGHPVRGNPFNQAPYRRRKFNKIVHNFFQILNTLPNGVITYNDTYIKVIILINYHWLPTIYSKHL